MEVLVHLVHELESVPKKLAFANAKDFTQTLLETRVFVRGDATGDQIPGAASMKCSIDRLSIAFSLACRCRLRAVFTQRVWTRRYAFLGRL
jgi:hypothetical protein